MRGRPLERVLPRDLLESGGVGEVLARLYPEGRVPLGDVAALTDKVVKMLETPVAVPPVEAFTLQAMLDETLRLYGELAP